MKPLLFLSPQEQKSIALLEPSFELKFESKMKVGDILHPESQTIIELKIGNDIHDYKRLFDELTRLNSKDYQDLKKYCLYVAEGYSQQGFHDYTVLVSACNRCGITPVMCFGPGRLAETVKKIIKGEYERPLQAHKQPSKELELGAKMLACFPGVSEEKAIELWGYLQLNYTLLIALRIVFGLNLDGSMPKIATDLYGFLYVFADRIT